MEMYFKYWSQTLWDHRVFYFDVSRKLYLPGLRHSLMDSYDSVSSLVCFKLITSQADFEFIDKKSNAVEKNQVSLLLNFIKSELDV